MLAFPWSWKKSILLGLCPLYMMVIFADLCGCFSVVQGKIFPSWINNVLTLLGLTGNKKQAQKEQARKERAQYHLIMDTIYCEYQWGVPLLYHYCCKIDHVFSLQQLLHTLKHQFLSPWLSYPTPTSVPTHGWTVCSYVFSSYPASPRGYCPWELRSITALMNLVTCQLEIVLHSLWSADSFNTQQPNYGKCNLPMYHSWSSTGRGHDLETGPQCRPSTGRERWRSVAMSDRYLRVSSRSSLSVITT